MTTKKIDREATIQKIMEYTMSNNAITIDVEKFKEQMTKDSADEFLLESSELFGTEVVYLKD